MEILIKTILLGHHGKEGRPRNLGRGVSKPKKNTVASLLAQSRAVGLKPVLTAQQLMNPAELEKLRLAISETQAAMELSATDTESIAESGMSESESEEQVNIFDLRVPMQHGWQRETIIHGLTKNGQIKGDVYYIPPGSSTKLKAMVQIQEVSVEFTFFIKIFIKEKKIQLKKYSSKIISKEYF